VVVVAVVVVEVMVVAEIERSCSLGEPVLNFAALLLICMCYLYCDSLDSSRASFRVRMKFFHP